jgi:hypothetical protein
MTTKRKVDPVTAVQDSIDGLALSLFEALRGVRDAVVPSSTPVDDTPASSSAFHEASSSEDHHPSMMHTTTAASSSTTTMENNRDVDDAARAARARLLDGLNVGYFSARAYDALEPDYEAFLLAYLGDDPHARELVEMMGSSSSSSSSRENRADGAKVMGMIGSDPSAVAVASVAVIRSSKAPATPGEDPSSSRSSSSSSSSSDDVKLPTTRTGSAKVEVGEVGYEFRKEFSSGWFVGRVTEIRPLAGE